jgi:NADH-quinone oxidoreductase subunit J
MTPDLVPVLPCAAVNWHSLFFLVFAVTACAFAVAVVVADNIVRMAVYLVFSLAATAGLFFLAGADFIGAMQLMIYVGGTLVLLVFGVMLTAQAPFVSIRTPNTDRVLAGIVGAALLAVLLQAAVSVEAWRRPASGEVTAPSATPIGMALVGVRVDEPGAGPSSGAGSAGAAAGRRSGYLLPFEIVSVHLLVVLVGAAYLARAKRRRTPRAIEMSGDFGTGPARVGASTAVGGRP